MPGLRRPSARRSASRPSRRRARLRSRLPRPAATRFLQVYVFRDHGVTDELIAEAIDAGFSAVFLTVDLPVVGPRDRERRIHWAFDDGTLPAVRQRARRGHDRRSARSSRPGAGLGLPGAACVVACRCPSSSRASSTPRMPSSLPSTAPRASWSRTTAAVSSTARCPRLEALPPIVDAVGDRSRCCFDGGIRRGTDVATALALGAQGRARRPDAALGSRGPRGGGSARGARAPARGARGRAPSHRLPLGRGPLGGEPRPARSGRPPRLHIAALHTADRARRGSHHRNQPSRRPRRTRSFMLNRPSALLSAPRP